MGVSGFTLGLMNLEVPRDNRGTVVGSLPATTVNTKGTREMKRGTPDHPKCIDLADRLKIERFAAVGILELLWHFTAQYAPSGDLSRFPAKAIAAACHWRKKADLLVAGLTEARWIDAQDDGALFIHDWPSHCDDATHMRVARSKELFADGTIPRYGRLPQDEREVAKTYYDSLGIRAHGMRIQAAEKRIEKASESPQGESPAASLPSPPLPSPSLPSHAQPAVGTANGPGALVRSHFPRWWAIYRQIREVGEDDAAHVWISIDGDEKIVQISPCLQSYLDSDEVARGAIMNGSKWLVDNSKNGWKSRWPKARQPQNREDALMQKFNERMQRHAQSE